jgi:hypothetical protein
VINDREFTLQRSRLIKRFCREEAQKLGEFAAVLRVLMNTELDVLAEGLVELAKIVLVFGDLVEKIERLLDEVLANNFKDLILLQGFSRDVKGKIFRVDNTLDEIEVLGDEILAVVHDEYTANIELDVVALLLGLEEIEGCTVNRK